MRIGILTGGGDVPGLGAAIKVVNRAASEGHEVVGIRRGWGGLLDTEGRTTSRAPRPTRWRSTPEWCGRSTRSGGTFLHTSRTNPAKVKAADEPAFLTSGRVDEGPRDHTDHVLRVINDSAWTR